MRLGWLKILFNLSIISAILLVIYVYLALSYVAPNDVVIKVEKGDSIHRIVNKLSDAGIVYNKLLVIGYLVIKQQFKDFAHVGEYQINKGDSALKIVNNITDGVRLKHAIKILEGLTAFQIQQLISAEDGLQGELSVQLENCNVMPDTYTYYYPDTKDSIVLRMRKALDNFMLDIVVPTDFILKDKKQVINLASIVELETPIDEERADVAGVYLNRLKIDMPLQADPTVEFAISGYRGDMGRLLLLKDLKFDDPYNTYLYKGLPPTAIACPSKKSILAVVNYKKHDYLYFVADGSGGHVFAKTYEEHLQNVKKRAQARKVAK